MYEIRKGLAEPLIVIRRPGKLILVDGHHRAIAARKLGIKSGMRVKDVREICPEIIVRENDTLLIRDASSHFIKICKDYSPLVIPKSIDEVIVDFSKIKNYWKKSLTEIGLEIKKRFRKEIGEWISSNIGISTNRMLAKLASSLHKPDGLDIINHLNIHQALAVRCLP